MVANKIDVSDKRKGNISPTPYKSKYEYFDTDIENNIDELEYIYSLPKSGYSGLDFLLRNGEKYSQRVVAEYVEVLLKGNCRGVFGNVNKIPLRIDDIVVVECENGIDIGRVCEFGSKAEMKSDQCQRLQVNACSLLRVPDLDELKVFNKKLKDESEVLRKSRELVAKYGFEMKITEANWQFDRQRLTIFFTAPHRIDFREMVKEMARLFKARIELRQISSREETKRLGNFVGPCGRELCCTSFMSCFDHVTLDHARAQQLSNNISKLSGNCGRLKCCIKFEYETYAAANEKYPPLGSVVINDNNSYQILKIDIFNGRVTTYNEQQSQYVHFTSHELSEMIKSGRLIIADIQDNSDRFNNFDEELKALLE
jgi:cell fate regulator YaaT (PSP1 superfamily)